jgi:glyoxylase-like metal-dependent hydrolase (beta-lactamase superfamily II)/ferredoxin
MASPAKSLPENVPGEFFVDSTCIDCDTCRQLAPQTFGETGEFSFVKAQPADAQQTHAALQALVSCPTGSIGTRGANRAKEVMRGFPLRIEDDVYYCGFNSPKSFGGNSYFVRHPDGNWLIDSPKYLPLLAKAFEQLGGLAYIFLTHRDDVADAERYAEHFHARRIIHRDELDAQPGAEWIFEGEEPIELAKGFVAIPTPGHTRGHMVLLYENRYLFTGDHLWWDRDDQRLGASRSYCWYSWPRQIESMSRLLKCQFEWVLPGHGQRVQLPDAEMRQHLSALVERMRKSAATGASSE